MRKFSFLLFFLTLFSTACSDGSTPSSDGLINPSSYPDKISLSKPSLFIEDSTVKGYLPYPIAPSINTEISGRESIQLKYGESGELYIYLLNSDNGDGTNITSKYSGEKGGNFLENKKDRVINLFKGQEANIKLKTTRFNETNRFCMDYYVENNTSNIGLRYATISYKQTSDTTFEKIGSRIYTGSGIEQQIGESC